VNSTSISFAEYLASFINAKMMNVVVGVYCFPQDLCWLCCCCYCCVKCL